MRMTMFRQLMAEEFGRVRGEMLAQSHVFAELDGRTVDQALGSGADPKLVWRTVCEAFDVPRERR
ncbi:MAG: DUF3046 domain-containing protein [Sciscionella sp.]